MLLAPLAGADNPDPAADEGPRGQVFTNARIYTGDAVPAWTEAMAIRGGRSTWC
jgi:hypothetical protein